MLPKALWLVTLIATSAGLGFVAACSGDDGDVAVSVAQADVSRDEDPTVATDQLTPLVEGNTAFATDLYGALRQESGNLFFSPHSISIALGMTFAGAAGATASEMAKTLHFDLPPDQLHAAFNRLDLELAARSEVELEDDAGEPFELSVANAIWAERTYEFLDPFLETLALNYGAGARLVDFINDPEAARMAINDWVSGETNDRIPELVPPGVIDAMTRLVLTNAIFFMASWAEPFPEEQTQDGAFHLLSGTTVTAPLMHTAGPQSLLYAEGEDYQAVELPYAGEELAMLLVLPEDGDFAAFEEGFDADMLAGIVDALAAEQVSVVLPKFEFSTDVGLKPVLTAMGMASAFEPGVADFSGMDGTRELYIQDALHKAFVAVDEQGTEAAAATAIVIGVTSVPLEPKLFQADRPFLFLIRDRITGAVLFLGRVVDPTR
jgi:serine protease inhibitor